MRVLLIAEAANPEWVSVPLEGWAHARAIAGQVDAHVVTQVRNRAAFLRAGLREGEDFTAIDSERVARLGHRAATLLRGGAGQGWAAGTAAEGPRYRYFERLGGKRVVGRRPAGEVGVGQPVSPPRT